MSTFADKVIQFYINIKTIQTPAEIKVLNPYRNKNIQSVLQNFFKKFYDDNHKRTFVFGINPGRFGAGITGINFTDPYALKNNCAIDSDISGVRELSAEYIYKFIDSFGGVEKFYRKFYITSICPLGFTKSNKNFNYYDNAKFRKNIEPFIHQSITSQISFGAHKKTIVLGKGKNSAMMEKINNKYKYFDELIFLEHPRFIMQYKRSKIDNYIKKYSDAFENILG